MKDNYRIEYYGYEYPDYFPGVSTVFTDYDTAIVGVGYDAHDALDDALNVAAESYDFSLPEKVEEEEHLEIEAMMIAGQIESPESYKEECFEEGLVYHVILYFKRSDN